MKTLLLLCLCALACAAQQLRVYAIDVEGGKATLYVSPSGQSMLLDTGYEGFQNRDADRIVAAAKDAGVAQIDYLVITHYHADHVGGVPQLAARIPIRNFVDHGKNHETVKDVRQVVKNYQATRAKGRHIVVKPGDHIPVSGLDVQVVAAAGKTIHKPLPGAGMPNPLCAAYRPMEPEGGENPRSIGIVLAYGKFRLVDLGDLYWNQEHELVCPDNLLGKADVYMTSHHGKLAAGAPSLVQALAPRAAIMNNGPKTGGAPVSWQTIHESPGTPDIWQLHYALANDAAHNSPDEFVANRSEDCTGNWIRLTARPDGTFTIQNGRTRAEKAYQSQ